MFLLDSDFKIERPKRYYRITGTQKPEDANSPDHKNAVENSHIVAFRSQISKFLHIGSNGHSMSNAHSSQHEHNDQSNSSGDESSAPSVHAAPMLDPSTNLNPLGEDEDINNLILAANKKRGKRVDVSKHTFYIENSQSRLKLFARNEVSLALDARKCPYFDLSRLLSGR